MRKIVVAPDSFKGSLTSLEAAQAMEEGVKEALPDCEVVSFPVADGGEGFLSVLNTFVKGEYVHVKAHGPLMEPVEAGYLLSNGGKTAWIEMAAVCGLPLVPVEKRNPMRATTYGLGELINDALGRECREFIIGIGGSATNDAGLGMLQALGFRFLDKERRPVGKGGEAMAQVASIDASGIHPALNESAFIIAADVKNPFCGTNGAACVFAPQKGADEEMLRKLDRGMWNLSRVIYHSTGEDMVALPGAGAAGGVGGTCLALLNATLQSGIQLVLDRLEFDKRMAGADLIITGEGKADKQSLMGKMASGILQRAQQQRIPVALLAGAVEDKEELLRAGFREVMAVTPPDTSYDTAMNPAVARMNVRKAAVQICKNKGFFF